MTTQLVRDTIKAVAEQGIDPTQTYWFDATGCFENETEVTADYLQVHRPPFSACTVCWQGKSSATGDVHAWTYVKGTNPHEGIVVEVFRRLPDQQIVSFPPLMYYVENANVHYRAADNSKTIKKEDAEMILSFIGAWYGSLSRRCEAYIPSVPKTFTNKRKIAQGKLPTYEWRTVTIEPVEPRKEHKGGTHASPRLHDRRGHLRRLRSGKNVWVKPCKVGDANKGIVFKDYQIKEKD